MRSFDSKMNELLHIARERFVASLRKEFSKVINIDEKEDCLTNYVATKCQFCLSKNEADTQLALNFVALT